MEVRSRAFRRRPRRRETGEMAHSAETSQRPIAGPAPDTQSGTTGVTRVPFASPGALSPHLLSADARLQEVASLLAAGFLRHWRRRAPDFGEKDLDVLRTSSEVCPKPQSEGESL